MDSLSSLCVLAYCCKADYYFFFPLVISVKYVHDDHEELSHAVLNSVGNAMRM